MATSSRRKTTETGGRTAGTDQKGTRSRTAGTDGRGTRTGSRTARAGSRTTGAGTRGTGKARTGQVQEPLPQEEGFLYTEAAIILSFALAVLLFLSNFHLCGIAGDYLRGVQLGLFGFMGYLVPLLLFVGTAFYVSNRGNPAAMGKLAAGVVAFLMVCGFLQQFFGTKPAEGAGLLEYYHLSAPEGHGGGLAGGLVYGGISSVLGGIGAFLVELAGFLISAVCITERSLVKAVKKRSDAAYQYAREDMDRRKEQHAQRQDERRRLREERVRGVNLSSTDLSAGVPVEESWADGYEEDYIDGGYPEEGYPDDGYPDGEYPDQEYPETDTGEGPGGTPELGPADVFTGTISPSFEYDGEDGEDTVPFDADDPEALAASAQRLVASGIRGYGDYGDDFHRDRDRTAPVSRFLDPDEEEEDGFRIPVAPGDWRAGTDLVRDAGPEIPIRMASRQHEPEDDRLKAMEDESGWMPSREPGPEDQGGRDYGRPGRGAGDILNLSPYMPEPATGGPEGDGGISRAEPGPAGSISVMEDEEDHDFYDKEPAGIPDTFSIPEEPRRVVTATGKIIETDTEMLQKRIEKRRQEAAEEGEASVQQQILEKEEEPRKEYVFPSLELLKKGNRNAGAQSDREYRETAIKLQQTLRDFGVGVTVTNISCGPSVTRYELHPEQGVKVSRIVGLADDIKLSLAAEDIRIEAPIPGKSAVGIEVPNKENTTVYLRDLFESDSFQQSGSNLAFAVGKDIGGQVVVTDIAKMPHLLIAGATGSGKSVCINTLIMSIIYKADPEDVKLIMVDPKVVELSIYNGIPHLLIPVVTDPKKASGALNWAVAEMMDRYKKFAECNVREVKGYNARIEAMGDDVDPAKKPKKLPQIVIIVDELADLMMVAAGEVEDAICRLAQLARAAGIHLVIATQRPSVNVITGLIKANIPSRVAFAVSSGVDSRTIIDMNGAEKLLGKGDMLFYPAGYPKPRRVQGAFVSDQEVQAVVEFLTEQGLTATYSPEVERQMSAAPAVAQPEAGDGRDEYFVQAGRFIIEKEKASIGMLQRMFKIGFNRAARIMDQLSEAGVVGPEEGTKPRRILMTMEEFEELLEEL